MIFNKLFDLLDMGIVILDSDLRVQKWNKWMELHSNIPANHIIGSPIFDFFPHLNNPGFLRSLKYVMNFGNYYFFSQKLHHYLFPFKPVSSLAIDIEYMQQSCNMGQLIDDESSARYIYITVHDVTEISVYERTLVEMNTKDNLTKIYNRKFLENQLDNEFKRFKRGQRPFSLIMLDIDFFKKINDTYGHLCGDYVLKSLASSISSKIRSTDTLARYGGEEFFCLLTETDIGSASHLAETLRKTVENETFTFQDIPVQLTISLGVTAMTPEVQSPEVLLRKADDALYEAKRTGRNKVVVIQ
jgi:diguanylate cyclase (GGDEF)-like protein